MGAPALAALVLAALGGGGQLGGDLLLHGRLPLDLVSGAEQLDGHVALGWPTLSRGAVPAAHLGALCVLRPGTRQQRAHPGPWRFSQGRGPFQPFPVEAGSVAGGLGLKERQKTPMLVPSGSPSVSRQGATPRRFAWRCGPASPALCRLPGGVGFLEMVGPGLPARPTPG